MQFVSGFTLDFLGVQYADLYEIIMCTRFTLGISTTNWNEPVEKKMPRYVFGIMPNYAHNWELCFFMLKASKMLFRGAASDAQPNEPSSGIRRKSASLSSTHSHSLVRLRYLMYCHCLCHYGTDVTFIHD